MPLGRIWLSQLQSHLGGRHTRGMGESPRSDTFWALTFREESLKMGSLNHLGPAVVERLE